MSFPAYLASGTRAQGGSVTTLTPAIPATIASLDLLFCHFAIDDEFCDMVFPAPWSTCSVRQAGGLTVKLAFIFTSGSESAPVLSWTTPGNAFAQTYRFNNADFFQTFPNQVDNWDTGNPHTVADLVTFENNSRVVYFDSAFANTALGTPAGWTEDLDNGAGSNHNTVGGKNIAVAGSSAGAISVNGASSLWHMLAIEIYAPAIVTADVPPQIFVST